MERASAAGFALRDMAHADRWCVRAAAPALAVAIAFAIAGCHDARDVDPAEQIVARFDGGKITAADLQRESNRLPPALREQFETANGRREFVSAMIDKRLLAAEAKRRKLTDDPEVQRQVRELEERLAIQGLLATEDQQQPQPTDAEARAYYEARRSAFVQSERVRVIRVLAKAAAGSGDAERARARARASQWADRLNRGESRDTVAAEGDGPERARGGDFGFVVRGEERDPRLESAALALGSPGAVSPSVEIGDGFAVLVLVERVPTRTPPFEEIRSEVLNRMTPERKRRSFDALLSRLRQDAHIDIQLQRAPQ